MHPFTIDFITGNTAEFGNYGYDKEVKYDSSTTVPDEENYFNTTQNLEDIYSVIRNDPVLSSPSPDFLVPTRAVDAPSPGVDYLVATPDPLDRGTPSPTQDSGIESTECSPVQAVQDVKEELNDLEKKAEQLTKPSESSTEKPGLSYIALIARAIISTHDRKMTLGEIYKHIRDNHSYYDNEERAWRNSIRYNLSINECFIKAGKEESGKGNYWAIHEQCLTDFENGDYRRRQARRRARRGVRVLDSEPAPVNTSRNVAYAPMTPSFIGYHPYGSRGMIAAQPYSAAPQQFYQSQRSAIPAPTPTYFHGNQMYPGGGVPYSGYHGFMTSPYSHMMSQGMDQQKPVDSQKYLQNLDRSNTVIINT